jgi:hypothetical protein
MPYLHHKITNLKSLSQFFNTSKISAPKSLGEWRIRVLTNLNFFQSNYLVILCLVGLFELFQNIYLLFALAVFTAGVLALQRYELDDIVIGGQIIPVNKNYLYIALLGSTVPVILFSSPLSTLMSLVSITAAIVVTHASLIDSQSETSFNESPV